MTLAVRWAKDEEAVPGYKLGRFLGRGGWGEVWEATRADGTMAAHPTPDCHSAGLVVHSLDSCLGRLRRPSVMG